MGKPAFRPRVRSRDLSGAGGGDRRAQLPHSAGIPLAIAKNPSQFRQGRDDRNELRQVRRHGRCEGGRSDEDAGGTSRGARADLHHQLPRLSERVGPSSGPKHTSGTRTRTCSEYYPHVAMEESLAAYDDVDQGAVRERRLKGWENVKRFHKMFVDAGGRLIVSGNLNDRYVPGLELFQEMRIMREVGMTPMQIIVGSTKYRRRAACRSRTRSARSKRARLADVLVVAAIRCRTSSNLMKTDTVIFDGKVIDRAYHANYTTTFNPPGDGANSRRRSRRCHGSVALMKARAARGGGARAKAPAEPAGSRIPPSRRSPRSRRSSPFIVTQGTTPCDRHAQGRQLRAQVDGRDSRASRCRHRS